MKAREIISQIESLPPADRQEVVRWLWTHVEESPEILEFIDEGSRSLEQEPGIPAEEVRRKVRKWAAG